MSEDFTSYIIEADDVIVYGDIMFTIIALCYTYIFVKAVCFI